MLLQTQLYETQLKSLPETGRHILAQFDESSLVVYQAYKPSIAHYAVTHGCFGGEFSFKRMSWVKTSFLWMMYRSGWAAKPDQEMALAIWIKRKFFEMLLEEAVFSTYEPQLYSSVEEWKQALANSEARLQWDPDHDPAGNPLPRKAIQLGLRGTILEAYSQNAITAIEDISELAHQQREIADSGVYSQLLVPIETVYIPASAKATQRIRLED